MASDPNSSEIAEKTISILLVRGESLDGEPIYAYVAVRADRLEAFMEAQRSGTFYPEDHGVIVEAGTGEPTEEVKRKMEEEYGFDHTGMLDIPDPEVARDIASRLTVDDAASDDPDPEPTQDRRRWRDRVRRR
ncbi:MAG: hypothetical protein AAGG50_00920 [Bacteroidota bacterium]